MNKWITLFCVLFSCSLSLSSLHAEDAPQTPAPAPDAVESPKAEPTDTLTTNAPESSEYTLVYDMDLKKLGKTIKYAVDNSADSGKFDRIAYYMELTDKEGKTKWVYVSMDPFTDNIKKIGIPYFGSEIDFQQAVTKVNVLTNEPTLTAGKDMDGNIEFWPNNYAPANAMSVPGADSAKYDFGDQKRETPQDGHGCMQVHLTKEKQTVFAINCWKAGPRAELGIGNRPEQHPDWTFSKNSEDFPTKRLRILVRLVK